MLWRIFIRPIYVVHTYIYRMIAKEHFLDFLLCGCSVFILPALSGVGETLLDFKIVCCHM